MGNGIISVVPYVFTFMTELFITASDGYQLSALYATPVDGSTGTIIISSATGIKKEYYINFSRFLVQNGYNVLLYDYRGIGGSAPGDLRAFKSYMHEWGTKDMDAVLNFLVVEKKHTNIIWFGHSAGAQLVGFIKNKQYINKVVSVNSALGYWGYLPFPQKLLIWFLWKFAAPAMLKFYGYGTMKRIGWGEDLPPNMLMQWRQWCLSKTYFKKKIEQVSGADRFYDFSIPITSICISDDYLGNDKTVSLMLDFFPNARHTVHKLQIKKYTNEKVGQTGIFRKKFENSLWLLLVAIIEKVEANVNPANPVNEPSKKSKISKDTIHIQV
jgi:predicted alpha/beta hydrolase